MTMRTLRLSRSQHLEVVEHDAERLVVVTTYEPGGSAPPAHYHPSQDEQFDILDGTVRVDIDGRQRDLSAGDTLTVTPGQVHRMWNPATTPARVRWATSPALTTMEWFEGIDRLQADADARGREQPDLLAFARHAARHRELFRLVIGRPRQAGDALVAVLAVVGRVLGR